MPDRPLSREDIRALQSLSPFELKEKLREIAGQHEGRTAFQQLNRQLRDYEYAEIGHAIRTVAEEYLAEWNAAQG